MAKSHLPSDIEAGFLKDPFDLSQLELIDAKKVEAFVEKLNGFTPEILAGRKLVAAIGTGGTISSVKHDGIGYAELHIDEILAYLEPSFKERFVIVGLDAFTIDSSQMNYAHARDLAIVKSYIWRNTKTPFIGFLTTHGTDTMADSAATMSLMTGQGLPFSDVFTGAQKSIQEVGSDAPRNVRNALMTLEALHANDMAEVVIVMGDYAVLGTSALKVDDSRANAFAAPLHNKVTNFAALPVRLASWLKPRREQEYKPTIWSGTYSHTAVIQSRLGLNPAYVGRLVHDQDTQAILVYSYAAGTIDDAVADAIMKEAKARQIPVFVVSPVNSEYKVVYESGKKLVDKGVVPLFMTLPTALAKIEIALRLYPGDIKAMSAFMQESYVGEVPSEQSRLSMNPGVEP